MAINKITKAIGELDTATKRTTAVKEFFGKGGLGADMKAVGEEVEKTTAKYARHEESLKKLAIVSDGLKESMTNLQIAFADVVAPLTREGAVSIEKFKATLLAMGSYAVVGGIASLVTVLLKVVAALREGAKLGAAITAMQGLKGLAQVGIAAGVYYGAGKYFESQKEEDIRQGNTGSPYANNQAGQLAQDEAQKENARRKEIDALDAKIKLTKDLGVIDEANLRLKIDALTKDKYANDIATSKNNLAAELARLESQRVQNLSKEGLSALQIQKINEDIDEQENRARKKSALDQKYIIELKKVESQIIKEQLSYDQQKGKYETEHLSLRMRSLVEDKYAIELADIELKRKEEIAEAVHRINTELSKANQSDQAKAAAAQEYKLAVEKAFEREKANKDYSVASKEKELRLMQQQLKYQNVSYEFQEAELEIANESAYMRDFDAQKQLLILNNLKTQSDFDRQRQEAKDKYLSGDLYDAEIQRINIAAEAEQRLYELRVVGIDLQERQQKRFADGWDKAFREYANAAENYGKLGADMFASFTNSMSQAIDTFVKTGKLNFKDFAKSIIQDIIAMYLKFQAMQLIMGAMRFFGGGASFNQPPTSAQFLMSGVQPKAVGGSVSMGSPYLVGENGAELFVPSRSGSIVPNGQLSSAMSSQPQVVYNAPVIQNMSAIDTQSAMQFLASNKQGIWAAYQSANRSVPISR